MLRMEEFSEERSGRPGFAAGHHTRRRDLIGSVDASLLAFAAGAPQSDDITMVAVRRTQITGSRTKYRSDRPSRCDETGI